MKQFWLASSFLMVLGCGLSLFWGPIALDPYQCWLGLWALPTDPAWIGTIVFDLRLPRVGLAFLAGAGLAVSGVLLQSLFANPLAGPGLLGNSSAAALGAVLVMVSRLDRSWGWSLPLAAVLGSWLCTQLILRISDRLQGQNSSQLLLLGVALGGVFSAMTSCLLSINLPRYEVAGQIMRWMMGGLDGLSWSQLWVLSIICCSGIALAWRRHRDLDLFCQGEATAQTLGVEVGQVRRQAIVLSSWLTGWITALVGVLGFVGVMVPHMARRWVGPSHLRLIPASAWLGGLFLIWCDLLTRLSTTWEIRLGVVTSLLGAPFFLLQLLR